MTIRDTSAQRNGELPVDVDTARMQEDFRQQKPERQYKPPTPLRYLDLGTCIAYLFYAQQLYARTKHPYRTASLAPVKRVRLDVSPLALLKIKGNLQGPKGSNHSILYPRVASCSANDEKPAGGTDWAGRSTQSRSSPGTWTRFCLLFPDITSPCGYAAGGARVEEGVEEEVEESELLVRISTYPDEPGRKDHVPGRGRPLGLVIL
ncbi:hypothetical protein BJ166DRAFT_494576 [Pestalotiopsis sp. NC0098]|nr:hypothetical protein BJ166DRAFT_494576 [Pestalotiopsis sp. NC0098]